MLLHTAGASPASVMAPAPAAAASAGGGLTTDTTNGITMAGSGPTAGTTGSTTTPGGTADAASASRERAVASQAEVSQSAARVAGTITSNVFHEISYSIALTNTRVGQFILAYNLADNCIVLDVSIHFALL